MCVDITRPFLGYGRAGVGAGGIGVGGFYLLSVLSEISIRTELRVEFRIRSAIAD